MRNVFPRIFKISKPLLAATSAVGILAIGACSSDVQRFGQVGSSAPRPQAMSPDTVAATPLASLPGSSPVYTGSTSAPGRTAGPGGTIRVGTGDTLYNISRANGVTVEDMAAVNGIPFPYHVRFGQTLRLPGNNAPVYGAPRSTAAAANIQAPATQAVIRTTTYGPVHVVEPAETLYSVSRRYGVNVKDLAYANNLTLATHLKTGQRITIPSGSNPVARQAVQQTQPSSNGSVHVVEPSETLYSISRRYRVNVKDLAYANGLTLSSGIKIGQRMTIPSGPVARPRQASNGGSLNQMKAAPAPVATPIALTKPIQPQSKIASARKAERIGPLAAPPSRSSSQFRWPVRGRLISRFGPQSDGQRNDGVNISVPEGTSVKAAENGVVAYSGSELKGYGNLVLIRHTDDWVTAYAHNSKILVSRGDTVKRGQIIAKAGKTGSVSKPQVHFEVRKGAKAVDPLTYLDGA